MVGFMGGLKCVMVRVFPETDQNVANEAKGGIRGKIG